MSITPTIEQYNLKGDTYGFLGYSLRQVTGRNFAFSDPDNTIWVVGANDTNEIHAAAFHGHTLTDCKWYSAISTTGDTIANISCDYSSFNGTWWMSAIDEFGVITFSAWDPVTATLVPIIAPITVTDQITTGMHTHEICILSSSDDTRVWIACMYHPDATGTNDVELFIWTADSLQANAWTALDSGAAICSEAGAPLSPPPSTSGKSVRGLITAANVSMLYGLNSNATRKHHTFFYRFWNNTTGYYEIHSRRVYDETYADSQIVYASTAVDYGADIGGLHAATMDANSDSDAIVYLAFHEENDDDTSERQITLAEKGSFGWHKNTVIHATLSYDQMFPSIGFHQHTDLKYYPYVFWIGQGSGGTATDYLPMYSYQDDEEWSTPAYVVDGYTDNDDGQSICAVHGYHNYERLSVGAIAAVIGGYNYGSNDHQLRIYSDTSLTWADELTAASTFDLSSTLGAYNVHDGLVASSTIGFTYGASHGSIRVTSASSSIDFSDAANIGSTMHVNVRSDLAFSNTVIWSAPYVVLDARSRYEPDPPILLPGSYDDVLSVTLSGPYSAPTTSIILDRPDFGNVQRYKMETIIHRTRSGAISTYNRLNPKYVWDLQWGSLFRDAALELEAFIEDTRGEELQYVDHEGRSAIVIVTSDAFVTEYTGKETTSASLLLEGNWGA